MLPYLRRSDLARFINYLFNEHDAKVPAENLVKMQLKRSRSSRVDNNLVDHMMIGENGIRVSRYSHCDPLAFLAGKCSSPQPFGEICKFLL